MAVDTFIAFVAVYDSVADAEADYELVKDLHTEANLIDAYDAAVVEREADGKVKIRKKHETPTRVGGVAGAGVGLPRADGRGDEACALIGAVVSDRLADQRRQKRADNAEHRCDDEAARIPARHQKLGDDPDDETKQNPTEYAQHANPPSTW